MNISKVELNIAGMQREFNTYFLQINLIKSRTMRNFLGKTFKGHQFHTFWMKIQYEFNGINYKVIIYSNNINNNQWPQAQKPIVGKCVGFHENVDDFIVLLGFILNLFTINSISWIWIHFIDLNIEIDANIFFQE